MPLTNPNPGFPLVPLISPDLQASWPFFSLPTLDVSLVFLLGFGNLHEWAVRRQPFEQFLFPDCLPPMATGPCPRTEAVALGEPGLWWSPLQPRPLLLCELCGLHVLPHLPHGALMDLKAHMSYVPGPPVLAPRERMLLCH